MDDQDDREYSRAPELEDLLSLCKALNAEGVRYVLIGGFAVILHGFVRATKDIDRLVSGGRENQMTRLRCSLSVRTRPKSKRRSHDHPRDAARNR